MHKALIVSRSGKSIDVIKKILGEEGYGAVKVASNDSEVRYFLKTEVFDLVFVNTPLEGENGLSEAVYAAEVTCACVVAAISRAKITNEIVEFCTSRGILVIGKPIDRHLFHHYLMFTDCFRSKLLDMMNENSRLKNTVEELKLIDRAKCLLIQTLFMTEEQAHRYLEKQAMDMRQTKLEVAKQVIKTYGQ